MWKFSYEPSQFKSTLEQQERDVDNKRKQKEVEQNRKIEAQPNKKIPQSKNLELAQDLGTSIQ